MKEISQGSENIDVSLDTKKITKDINNMTTSVSSSMKKLDNAILSSTKKLSSLEKAQVDLGKKTGETKKVILEKSSVLATLKTKYDEANVSLNAYGEKLNESKTAIVSQNQVVLQNVSKTEELRISYQGLKDTLGKNAQETINVKEALEKSKVALADNKQILEKLEVGYKTVNSQYKENVTIVKQCKESVKNLEKELNSHKETLNSTIEKLEQTNNEIENQKNILLDTTSSWVTLKTEICNISGDMEQIGESLKSIEESVSNIGSKITASITKSLVDAGVVVTKFASDFETAFCGVKEITEDTEKNISQFHTIVGAFQPIVSIISKLINVLGTGASIVSTVTEAISIMGTTAGMAITPTVLLANTFTLLLSKAFIIPATIVAITTAIANFTPIGDSAYSVLVALGTGFTVFKSIGYVQSVITGLTTVMIANTGVTTATTASVIAYTVAEKTRGIATGLTTAVTAISTVALIAYNTACSSGSVIIGIVTAAQWAWNAAMIANPIGLIIAGVAGLVAGIGFLIGMLNRESESTKQLREENEKLIEKQNTIIDNIATENQAYDESVSKINNQKILTRDLAKEIEALSNIENKSIEDKALLKTKIDQLNESVPELALAYNQETDALNLSTESINTMLLAQETQIELNNQLAEQQKLKEDEIILEENMLEAKTKRLDIEEQLSNAENLSYNDKVALNEEVEKLTEAELNYKNALIENKDAQEFLNGEIKNNSVVLEENNSKHQENLEALKAQEEAAKKAGEAYEKYANMTTEAFKKIKEEEAITMSEMAKNIEENSATVEKWSRNLEELASRGVNEGLLQQLRDAGPEMAKTVANIVNASDDEIAELNTALENGTKIAIESMQREMGLPSTINAGKDMIDDIAENTTSSKTLEEAVKNQIINAKSVMNSQVKASNFSSVGNDMAKGVAIGIESGIGVVSNASRKIINASINAMRETADTHSPSKETISIANDMGDGLVVGTEDKILDVATAGDVLATSYIESVKNGFDVGLADASYIMLGQWTELYQGMDEITKNSGADIIQSEIDYIDKLIEEIEKKNAEILKAEEIANKEREILEITNNADRINAQNDFNKTLAENDLEAMKERSSMLKEQLKEIQNAYEDMNDAIVSALKEKYSKEKELSMEAVKGEVERRKEASSAIIEQYEREYEARLKTLDIEESDEVLALQMQINALDEKTEAEERALKAQENQKRLFDLEQLILQAETEEEKIASQEKYNEEYNKQQRATLLQQRKDEKESLREKIAEVKASYKEQKDLARADIEEKRAEYKLREEDTKNYLESEKLKIDEHYTALSQKERLEAEARKLMIDGNQEEIVKLLNQYTPDWAYAGQSAGEAFLKALQGVTPSIESEVSRIMGLINQVESYENNLSSNTQYTTNKGESSLPKSGQTYTVKKGDTLSSIASKYGVKVWDLRNENGLDPKNDTMLQIGKTLKIPILHKGGVSLKEQVALINEKEAIAPLADLYNMMESAVTTTANKLVAGFANSIKSYTNNVTNNNDNGLNFTVNYQGNMSKSDVYDTSRLMAEQTRRELRGRGLTTY